MEASEGSLSLDVTRSALGGSGQPLFPDRNEHTCLGLPLATLEQLEVVHRKPCDRGAAFCTGYCRAGLSVQKNGGLLMAPVPSHDVCRHANDRYGLAFE